ncbi:MAG TPA: pyridoxal-phosphate dependent enzyme [Candidatus Limnocylindria bacterium]|nr:pyridoxal-phosphate dependent enzyme [Candidatus Limnocylindria bacterium]
MEPLPAVGLDEVRAAAELIRGDAIRAPLLRLGVHPAPEIHVKLENLQPMGSFKLRGAINSVAALDPERIANGLSTASAGNMARAVASLARRHGVSATMIVPDSAPAAKLEPVRALGARVIPVPFADWWQAMEEGGHPDLPGAFLHPCASRSMIAGDGTVGLELVEDLPGLAAVVVPFGGGGLASGIACAVKALRPEIRVYAAEVEGAAPLAAALVAGRPVEIERRPSFVDGIGSGTVLPAMWPLVSSVLDGSIVVSLEQVESALRLLATRLRVVAEGAGAAALAAALTAQAGEGPVVAVISGGNIDPAAFASIVAGGQA